MIDFLKVNTLKNLIVKPCYDRDALMGNSKFIPYGRQDITEDDIAAVENALRSDFLTQGPMVPLFEKAVASYTDAQHAVGVNSATSALHIACLALGVGKGDRVWTSPLSFVASANCALYCGADVDFVDIDPLTWNMSPARLQEKLVAAKASGQLPKVVIPVHLCGASADMRAIHTLAQEYGFRIIEDASHAVGGRYGDLSVGSCQYSDITVFSFHPVKIVTAGEGGVALTNDDVLAKNMAMLRSHGITRDSDVMENAPEGPWYYEQKMLGFNYRMTDIHAALGLSQWARLDGYIQTRHQLVQRYNEAFENLPLATQRQEYGVHSAWHLYVIRVGAERHLHVFNALKEAGIGVNLHYIPIHQQPFYRALGFNKGDFPEAEKYYAEAITLPIFPRLSHEDQDRVIAEVQKRLS